MGRYGDRRYRAMRAALRDRVAREHLPCAVCHEPIDIELPAPHPRSFSADHVTELAAGGDLHGELAPTHLGCNSSRGSIFGHAKRKAKLARYSFQGEKPAWRK